MRPRPPSPDIREHEWEAVPVCPLCALGRAHTMREHQDALTRAREQDRRRARILKYRQRY